MTPDQEAQRLTPDQLADQLADWLETEAAHCQKLSFWVRDGERVDSQQQAERALAAATLLRSASKEKRELRDALRQCADEMQFALNDFETINQTLVKIAKVHPYTITPARLAAALASARTLLDPKDTQDG